MLGYVLADGDTAGAALAEAASRLGAMGVPVAGALQHGVAWESGGRAEMDLRLLDGSATIRISQRLGPQARGCRLDPAGLERAVGLVANALTQGPALLVLNKFGRQEAQGRGFRLLIGEAVAAGVPVLTSVPPRHLSAFEAFAGDLAERLPDAPDRLVDWALNKGAAPR